MSVTYYAACTLDGFIARTDGGVDWLTPFQESGDDYGFTDFFAKTDSLVMGSATYEFMLGHPPWMAPDKPSWVFTKRDLEPAAPNVTLTEDEPSQVMEAIHEQQLQNTWLVGGGQLAESFRAQGLITDYVISMVPLLLGEGISLFARGSTLEPLKLVSSESYPSGIVQLSYTV